MNQNAQTIKITVGQDHIVKIEYPDNASAYELISMLSAVVRKSSDDMDTLAFGMTQE